jgi:pimeloyl-ACP methyl ester carboxylesterase
MDVRRVEANGIGFAYLERGPSDGRLALCLHGFPDHAPTYEGMLDALAGAGFRAVAPWMRGYAPTAVPADGRYQTAALAMDAIAVADALDARRPGVLIGHDWGAAAAYLAATHRPDRFERVVGLAVPPTQAMMQRFLFDPDQLQRSWYIFFFQSPLAETAVRANDFALVDKLWRDWSPGYAPPEEFRRALKDTLGSPGSLDAAIGYYRAMFDPSRHDPSLAEVQAKAASPVPVPALYLHGGRDGCLAADVIDQEALRAAFAAGVESDRVADAGHFLHLERPDVVLPRVVGFLTS